jgi:hypothetical protein
VGKLRQLSASGAVCHCPRATSGTFSCSFTAQSCLSPSVRLYRCDALHAVFSNAVLHWIKQADAVIEGVYRGLRPVPPCLSVSVVKRCCFSRVQEVRAVLEPQLVDPDGTWIADVRLRFSATKSKISSACL